MIIEMCLSTENKITKWNEGGAPTEVAINPADYPNLVAYLKGMEANGQSTSIDVVDLAIDQGKHVCMQVTEGRIYDQDYDCGEVVYINDPGDGSPVVPADVKAELLILDALV